MSVYDVLKDGYAQFEGVGDRAVKLRQPVGDGGVGYDPNRGATAYTHVHLTVYPQVSVCRKEVSSRMGAVLD